MSEFFRPENRPERGIPRTTFHVMLSDSERTKLVELTKRWKCTGAEAFRRLLAKAKF